MATSGTITGSFNGSNAQYLTFRCEWSVTSQDTANKTSTVRLRWIVTKTTASLYTNKANAPWNQSCDGTYTSGNVNFNLGNVSPNTDYVVRDVSIVIPHNANGTKTAAISGNLDLSGTSAGTGTFSGSTELPTIAVTPPTVSLVVSDNWDHINASITQDVGGYSRYTLTATATATSPATIANYAFYANDVLLQSGASNVYTYPSPVNAGTYDYKVVVTDSYGNTATSSVVTKTPVRYSMPTVYGEAYRCASASDSTPDPSGVYVLLRIRATYASNISGNTLTTRQTVLDGNTYTWNYDSASRIEGTFPTTNSYNAVFTVTDVIGNSATATVFIPTEFVNFDLYPDSEYGGAAFGMIAKQGIFSVNHDAEFLGDTAVSGAFIAGDAGGSVMLNGINFANITEYYDTSTTTTSSFMTKTYTASSSGIVIASVSVQTDTTNNYGNTQAKVEKNGVLYGYSFNRFASSTAYQFGANAVAAMKVNAGDTIVLSCASGKNGTKTGIFNCLAIGTILSIT